VDALLAEVDGFIRRHGLLPPGAAVLVAVSGGRDSTALLAALHALAPAHGWRLVVAHFDHGLRGAAAREDAAFVAARAAELGLPHEAGAGEAAAHARAARLSPEAAARALRLGFLAAAARRHGAAPVATAHHADDQAELVLLRLLRGAGGRGLGGMTPAAPLPGHAGLRLVRPFLGQPRAALAAWAAAQGVPFREDASNADPRFLRNRIRRRLLPALEREYQPALRALLARTAAITAAEADFAEHTARAWLAAPGGAGFAALHPAVQRHVVRLQLWSLAEAGDFALVEALRLHAGRPVNAAAGRRFLRGPDGRVRAAEVPPPFSPARLAVPLAGEAGAADFGGGRLRWRRGAAPGVPALDAAVLGPEIELRHWRPGDRFHRPGLPRPAKLQDLFTNARVPAAERRARVLATLADGRIFWVEGFAPAPFAAASAAPLAWGWQRPPA
jgi:tRNA(Ile)-lysidine synthase